MWPECKLVHGKPRHSQSQGSVERANQDVEAILAFWQKDNNTKHWSEGLSFIQWKKNNRFHKGIGRSPYEAVFGCKSRLGIHSLNIPDNLTVRLETEEQLEELAKELAPTEEEEATVASAEEEETNVVSAKEVVLNVKQEKILCARKGAKKCQGQAAKMVDKSVMRFKAAYVGDIVMVPIPNVDRGRAEFRNLKVAVIVDVKGNGLYKLGTTDGLLKQLYSRSQVMPCVKKFLSINDVPKEKEVCLRETTRYQSLGDRQGFLKCSCKTSCTNARCKRKKKGFKCNSKATTVTLY